MSSCHPYAQLPGAPVVHSFGPTNMNGISPQCDDHTLDLVQTAANENPMPSCMGDPRNLEPVYNIIMYGGVEPKPVIHKNEIKIKRPLAVRNERESHTPSILFFPPRQSRRFSAPSDSRL